MIVSRILRASALSLLMLFATTSVAQTAQTKKQSLPELPGFVLQDGTVDIIILIILIAK